MTPNIVNTLERIRRPAVAGYFYPADALALRERVAAAAPVEADRMPATAVLVPHGPYAWCARVLGAVFGRVQVPRCTIILAPSHTGSWMPWSIMERGAYRTPLGDMPLDAACAQALRARCPFLEADAWGQTGEHAVEVLLPFLQVFGPAGGRVVPIVAGHTDPSQRLALVDALVQVIAMMEEPVLLIASSDLSHYTPDGAAQERDQQLLQAACALDGARLEAAGAEARMCGAEITACVLQAAARLGASRGTIAAYATSAQSGGDPDSSVGYGGVVLS